MTTFISISGCDAASAAAHRHLAADRSAGCWFNLVRETVALKLQFTLLMALVGLIVATGESLANDRVIRLHDPAHVSHIRLTIDKSETVRADALSGAGQTRMEWAR